MDLVGFDEEPFRAIAAEFARASPQSSRSTASPRSRCRRGPATTSRCASAADAVLFRPGAPRAPRARRCRNASAAERPFRMPVQWVCRPNAAFPRFCRADPLRPRRPRRRCRGRRLGPHQPHRPHPRRRGRARHRRRRAVGDADADRRGRREPRRPARRARRPRRSSPTSSPRDLVWMDSEPMLPGRQYLLKSMTRIVPVQVTELKYRSGRRHARAQRREGAGAQ